MPRGIPNPNNIIATGKNGTDASAQQIGQDTSLLIPVTGAVGDIERTDQVIQVVDGPSLGEYAAELAFNEEVLQVMVHESTDKNAEQMVDVYVNGTPQRFLRGHVQSVKRKFVEVLARAKPQSITTSVQTTNEDVINKVLKSSALRYPFSVHFDPNPKGPAWLRKVLAEA